MDLSVIVPFVNEHPQVLFTAQSILNELRESNIKFELIMIDNWCAEVEKQGRARDSGSGKIEGLSKTNAEMTYLHYDKKLSHWQSKNMGVRHSSGSVLWFCDSHCIVSPSALRTMFDYYLFNYNELHGTLHLPLSYMLEQPGRELIYKLSGDVEKREFHYSFTRYRPSSRHYRVPCMSTCGMMMSREIYEMLGGWPEELGIYGGGENFINFTMASMGLNVNIMPGKPLWHYAEKRGYHWNFDDYLRNRMIATFMFGGYEMLKTYVKFSKGNELQKQRILESVITKESIQAHKEKITAHQTVDVVEWWNGWKNAA